MSNSGRRILVLDGWRGLGILLVIFTQMGFFLFGETGPHRNFHLLSKVVYGTFAIDVLFILSGFFDLSHAD